MALVLLIVGRQLLTVLDNQGLNRRLAAMVGELEHQAFHDGLTNLPDRALFRERVGDDLLVAVASRLRTCVRDEDTVARLGGDEFAILLEQAPSHEVAVRVAGRTLEAMRPSLAKARGKGRFELASTASQLDTVGTIPET